MHLVTIAIPTFSRAQKLMRTLKILDREIGGRQLQASVAVLVSDNCSEDNTRECVAAFLPQNFKLQYYRQPKNQGFDGNIKFLYERAESEYVWFMSDDDLLLPGAVSKVVDALTVSKPDLLLFSFQQPPGSKERTFVAAEPFEVFTSPEPILELASRWPKISIYVLRKTPFSEPQQRELDQFLGNGYFFLDLAFSVLSAAPKPVLCVIPEQLAACDDEYLKDLFDPGVILECYKPLQHPYVLRHRPDLLEKQKMVAYPGYIQFLFSYKTGALTAKNPAAYETGIKTLDFRFLGLVRNPKALLQFFLMKLNCVGVYLALRLLVDKGRRGTVA